MQHVHGVALERGLRKLSAQVSLSAEGFFARHGFLVDERQTVVVAGVRLENSRMSKWLMADNLSKKPRCSWRAGFDLGGWTCANSGVWSFEPTCSRAAPRRGRLPRSRTLRNGTALRSEARR